MHLVRDRRDDPVDLLGAQPEALRGPVVELLRVVPDGVVAPFAHVLDHAGDDLGHVGSVLSQRRGGRRLLQLPAHVVLQITSGVCIVLCIPSHVKGGSSDLGPTATGHCAT